MFSFKKFLAGVAIVLGIIFISQAVVANSKQNKVPLEVDYLNVGQGDSQLINYLGDYQILIDGGPDGKKVLAELGKVIPLQDKKIDVVVLTHPDKDHLAGLIDVAKNYDIGLFLDNGQVADTDVYRELIITLESKNVRRECVLEASDISIGSKLILKAFNPDEVAGDSDEDRNDSSVVLRLDFGGNSFLFTGDAEDKTEKDLIFDQEDIDVDWLKVSHHGSKYATSENFLQKVTPKHAVISVGENRYGHPTGEVLDRLKNAGAEILRTDEVGTIKVGCERPEASCTVLQN